MRLADTNVLIYAVSNREADAGKRARAEATLMEPDLALSVQVLQEFYHQATRPQGPAGLTHEQAVEFLRPLAALPTQEITVELFNRATEIRGEIRDLILGRGDLGGGEDAGLRGGLLGGHEPRRGLRRTPGDKPVFGRELRGTGSPP